MKFVESPLAAAGAGVQPVVLLSGSGGGISCGNTGRGKRLCGTHGAAGLGHTGRCWNSWGVSFTDVGGAGESFTLSRIWQVFSAYLSGRISVRLPCWEDC